MKNKIIDKFDPFNSSKLFGHDLLLNDLIDLFNKNKLPKVLLLSGEKGIGKFTLTFHFINYVLSKNTDKHYNLIDFEINKNSSIYEHICKNISQNFFYVSNYNYKTGIEDLRFLKKNFMNTSLNNDPRFIIFDDIEFLNVNSANSLLKFIEEPSSNIYFILINNQKQKIIETIKSRSLEYKIFLNSKSKDFILSSLLGIHNLNKLSLNELSSFSSPGNFIRFLDISNNLNLDLKDDLYNLCKILIDNYKKTKNELYIDFINLLIDYKFSKLINTQNSSFIKKSLDKVSLIKTVYNYKKFNLNSSSLLEYIKTFDKKYV